MNRICADNWIICEDIINRQCGGVVVGCNCGRVRASRADRMGMYVLAKEKRALEMQQPATYLVDRIQRRYTSLVVVLRTRACASDRDATGETVRD